MAALHLEGPVTRPVEHHSGGRHWIRQSLRTAAGPHAYGPRSRRECRSARRPLRCKRRFHEFLPLGDASIAQSEALLKGAAVSQAGPRSRVGDGRYGCWNHTRADAWPPARRPGAAGGLRPLRYWTVARERADEHAIDREARHVTTGAHAPRRGLDIGTIATGHSASVRQDARIAGGVDVRDDVGAVVRFVSAQHCSILRIAGRHGWAPRRGQ